MKTELQRKLAKLIDEKLKDEEEGVRALVFTLLTAAQAKQDIQTMGLAVRKMVDSEIEKGVQTGKLDYDEDDDKFDVL